MKLSIKLIFDKVIGVVFAIMLLFLTIGIIIGTGRLFFLLFELVRETGIAQGYLHVVSEVLSLFVLIELSRSLVGYFSLNRLRMTFIVDAAIVFVLRDVMIGLFENKLAVEQLYAFSALLLVLGLLRIGSIIVFQRGHHLGQDDRESD